MMRCHTRRFFLDISLFIMFSDDPFETKNKKKRSFFRIWMKPSAFEFQISQEVPYPN